MGAATSPVTNASAWTAPPRSRVVETVRSTPACPVNLTTEELELIDRLVRSDRTAVSTALLAIAGIGAAEARQVAVLDWIGAATESAVAAGAISSKRADQIARHITRAIGLADLPIAV